MPSGDRPVYLDYNATTPVDPAVIAELTPFLASEFGNPSSVHSYGVVARAAVDLARERVARLIGAEPGGIVFTGSGSESNHLAILGTVLANSDRRRDTIVTQVTEHPSVLAACRAAQRHHGCRVVTLPVDRHGRVNPADVRRATDRSTLLVSMQLANGETGTIQAVAEIVRIARVHGAITHTDAAQAVGKIPVLVDELGVDLLSVAGHKVYAPKGVGALYRRGGIALEPIVGGGGQEGGLRSGTENVPYLVALGAACNIARRELAAESARLAAMRDELHRHLVDRLGTAVCRNGHRTARLPNTLNVSLAGIDARAVLAATPAVAASTAAACHSGSPEPSAVLLAMGLPPARALAALRLSVGRWTTSADVARGADALAATITDATRASHEVAGVQ